MMILVVVLFGDEDDVVDEDNCDCNSNQNQGEINHHKQ